MNDRQKSAESPASELLLEKQGGVARLTLNRPERRNALSLKLLGEFEAALARIAGDADVRVVVIAGAGRVFCARQRHPGRCAGRNPGVFRETAPRVELEIKVHDFSAAGRADRLHGFLGKEMV